MEQKVKINNYILTSSNKIKINSKDLIKNDIFIALRGSKYHGNKFINEAIKAGDKYCITDKYSYKFKYNKNVLLVDDTFVFLKDLSIKKRSLFKGEVIGITGSAGKTSLKENLKFFLKKKYKISASIKSYNNELGVMLSILNMNINSDYAIFEIGTNNFGEIKDLTKLVKPSQVFITNILSTHLENFKSKKNIAKEKSDIFNKKYNPFVKTLYFQNKSKEEKLIRNLAKKQKLKKIIAVGQKGLDCYIKNKKYINSNHIINLKILNKHLKIVLNKYQEHRLINLIFVFTFYIVNKINTEAVIKNINKIPVVVGRGSIHNLAINNVKIKLIDESYNANPETMINSINNFSKIKDNNCSKILILGNMNELGIKTLTLQCKVIKHIEIHSFERVILCGDFFKKALNMFSDLKNKYVYKSSPRSIMSYLLQIVHKKAIIMVKSSNDTEVNKLAKVLKLKKEG